jgi:hypothetical protein
LQLFLKLKTQFECGQIGEKFRIVLHHFEIILELSIKKEY